jgi:hypothetical protein
MLLDGKSYTDIAKEVGVAKSTISYHAKCLRLPRSIVKKYDWVAIQEYHDAKHTYSECKKKWGFASRSWEKAVQRGAIVPNDFRLSLEQMLVKDSPHSPRHLKKRVLEAGLVENKCYKCGIGPVWNNELLTLWLDHKNGDGDDWRPENLRLVCPNCDSQSPTYCGRNVGYKRRLVA